MLAECDFDINHGLAGLRNFLKVLFVELLELRHYLVWGRTLRLLELRLLLLHLRLRIIHHGLAIRLLGVLLVLLRHLLVRGILTLQNWRVVHHHRQQLVDQHGQVRLMRVPRLQVGYREHVLLPYVIKAAHDFLRQVLVEVAHRWRDWVV